MTNESFPSWVGPVAGAILGACLGVVASIQNDGEIKGMYVAVAAGIGLFAGGMVWLVDVIRKPRRPVPRDDDFDDEDYEDGDRPRRRRRRSRRDRDDED